MESKNSKHVLITEAPCLVILPQVMESTCTAKPCYCKSKSRFFAEAGKYFWLDYPLCYRGCFCAMLDLICKYSDAGRLGHADCSKYAAGLSYSGFLLKRRK